LRHCASAFALLLHTPAHTTQVRQFYLDPAIEQEFSRMRSDLAMRTTEAAAYKAKHEAANFNQVRAAAATSAVFLWLLLLLLLLLQHSHPPHPNVALGAHVCWPFALQDSKTGQALLNKVKLLAQENDELGRQQREGVEAVQVRALRGTGLLLGARVVHSRPTPPVTSLSLPPARRPCCTGCARGAGAPSR
jgi:hypothetical protein